MRTEEEWKNLEAERNAYQNQCISLKHKMRLANDEREALALRVQEQREALKNVRDTSSSTRLVKLSDRILVTPDTSAQILARLKAAVWMEAAEVCKAISTEETRPAGKGAATDCEDALHAKADELLNGLEKEHG